MAEIVPFRALRYNPQFVPDLQLVVAPPYDVISAEAQERYHARHPRNVVRLILAREDGQGAPGQDRYERAAWTFAAWQAGEIRRRNPSNKRLPTIAVKRFYRLVMQKYGITDENDDKALLRALTRTEADLLLAPDIKKRVFAQLV